MGNVVFVSGVQLRRRRLLPAVEERLTRPRRLVRELPDLDAGRLHRLIRCGDLAPCFDPAEDAGDDGLTEDCPICFFFYPSLNRSKCCGKGICTECFLQLMPSKNSKVVHCPFCKTKAYAIEYQGAQMTSGKKIKQEGEPNINETKIESTFEITDYWRNYPTLELPNPILYFSKVTTNLLKKSLIQLERARSTV